MIVHLDDGTAVLVSCVAWALIGVVTGVGWVAVDRSHLQHDGWLTRPRRFEDDGRWYRRRLRIRSWKDRLPEMGDLFPGGTSKRQLPGTSTAALLAFAAETRRAELVHWSNVAAGPLFLLWCPPLLGACMVAFGVVAHLPFIAVQRYNRFRLEAIVARRARLGRTST